MLSFQNSPFVKAFLKTVNLPRVDSKPTVRVLMDLRGPCGGKPLGRFLDEDRLHLHVSKVFIHSNNIFFWDSHE